MKNLLDLLQRFSKSLNKDALARETVSKVILERTGVSVPPKNIFLKDGVLEITAGAAAKNEIRLKEGPIKDELKTLHRLPLSRVIYK